MIEPSRLEEKSTIEEIRQRFDNDVERFSNLETGQSATIDAPLAMELITHAAVASTPEIRRILDIGCGAGNNTLRLRQVYGRDFDSDLLDLCVPMLERAELRVREAGANKIRVWQSDFRTIDLPEGSFDVVLAAAVLHHLRDDADWLAAFDKVYRLLAPGGSFWITDLVSHETAGVDCMMWNRYGESADESTAVKVAQRRGKPIVLIIEAGKMEHSGHNFFLSANGVWLTNEVPTEFIRFE